MQLSFHSLLASAQEVDFFTDIILDTGLAGDLEPDTSFVTELESIPPAIIEEEEEAAIEEQLDIEMALDEENLNFEYYVVILDDTTISAEEYCGTLEECKAYVDAYVNHTYSTRFTARFFHNGSNNEIATVEFFATNANPTGFITMTRLNNLF